MTFKAVILAAGLGNRISKVGSTPKPFLSIDGEPNGITFVDWHVARLGAAGVREVYVVGNQKTYEHPVRGAAGVNVRWVKNPSEDLGKSGSGHSAWFAWNSSYGILDGKSRVLLMDADILYEPKVLSLLVDKPAHRSRSLVCTSYRESNEELMVFGTGNRAVLHGKGLLGTGLVSGLECFGEATGIVLFEPADHALLAEATEWCMRYSTAKEKSEHEDVTQRMMHVGRVDVECFSDLLFMECDTPEEYDHLTTELYPRVARLV